MVVVLQCLETRRERLPGVMAEISVSRAGRQHERVVAKSRAVTEAERAGFLIDGLDGRQQGRDIGAPAQELADRPGDLGRRQRRRCDLVEKRLKPVVIASIDDRDLDRRAGEPVNRLKPAEPGADHDHMMSAHRPPSSQEQPLTDDRRARWRRRGRAAHRPPAPGGFESGSLTASRKVQPIGSNTDLTCQ